MKFIDNKELLGFITRKKQFIEIVQKITKIDPAKLDGKYHDCPLCGKKNSFIFFIEICGGYKCEECTPKPSNYFSLISKANNTPFEKTLNEIASCCGYDDPKNNQSKFKEPKEGEWDTYYVINDRKIIKFKPNLVLKWTNGYFIVRSEWIDKRNNKNKKATYQVVYGKEDFPLLMIDSIPENRDLLYVGSPDSNTVLIVEGETSTVAARKLAPKEISVATWVGGAKQPHLTDWKQLKNKDVYIWPDNDKDGVTAMKQISELGKNYFRSINFIMPPSQKIKGWDLADAVKEGWTTSNFQEHFRDNIRTLKEIIDTVTESNDRGDPFICLGLTEKILHFYCKSQKQIVSFSIKELSKSTVLLLAPLDFFINKYPKGDKEQTINLDVLINSLVRESESKYFNKNKVHGSGCWLDKGIPVFNDGKYILSKGQSFDLFDPSFENIYVSTKKIDLNFLNTGSVHDGTTLMEILNCFSFTNSFSAKFLAGWIFLAPIAGALDWRPHLWILGEAGSGKSTLLDKVVFKILHQVSLMISGSSSEAGIRQDSSNTSLPVIMDEGEAESRKEKEDFQKILQLIRSSSSNQKTKIVKGSASHESKTFSSSSAYLISSTGSNLERQADKTRFLILSLSKKYHDKSSEEKLRQIENVIDDNFANRILTRSIKSIDLVRHNFRIFKNIVQNKLQSNRLGDQFASLLAGYWVLMNNDIVDENSASTLVNEIDFKIYCDHLDGSQEQSLLNHILQLNSRIDLEDSTRQETIGAWLDYLREQNPYDNPDYDIVLKKLKTFGFIFDQKDDCVYIANQSKFISDGLTNSRYSYDYYTQLKRLPGANSSQTKHFAGGIGSNGKSRCVKIDFSLIFGNDGK